MARGYVPRGGVNAEPLTESDKYFVIVHLDTEIVSLGVSGQGFEDVDFEGTNWRLKIWN